MADMNATTPTNVDYTIPEIWSEFLKREWLGALLFARFMGVERSNMPVIMKSDLVSKAGDVIHFETIKKLSASGVVGDTATLEGNEEILEFEQVDFTPEFYRHGVAIYERAQKKSLFDLRTEAKAALAVWLQEKVDDAFYSASLAGTQVIYQGAVAGSGDLTTSHTLEPSNLSDAGAMLRNNNVPMVGGKNGYVAMIHSYQANQLSNNSTWHAGKRDARERNANNPIFKHFESEDYMGSWDGIHVFESSRVSRYSLGVSGYVSPVLVMGADAFGFALGNFFNGTLPIEWAEQTQDYGNKFGVAVKTSYEAKILEDESLVRIFTRCDVPTGA